MSKININDYEYIMYVDASGDDGLKLNAGSSLCYAVSCFLVKTTDIGHNIGVVNDIKKLMHYDINNPNHELKYTSLRRHPKSKEVHEQLRNLKGTLFSLVAFKEFLLTDEIVTTGDKYFPAFCHTFSINSLSYIAEEINNVLIVVDRMKQVEMDKVKFFGDHTLCDIENVKNHKIIFRDSKDKNFVLIQIADLLSGITRSFFELYRTDKGMMEYWNKCPLCHSSTKIKLHACKKNKNQIDYKKHYNFNCIKQLYYMKQTIPQNLCLLPPKTCNHFWFLECFKNAKK